MHKIILLGLSFALAMVAGCASTPKKIKDAPGWYTDLPDDDESYLYSATVGESRKADVATKKATIQARAELAQKLGTKVQNLEKLFQEEVGADSDTELLEQFTSVTKTITSETLHGTQQEERKVQTLENGTYRVYVLMSLPIGAANQTMMAKIKANEHLYTRFRASKAFEDLDADIKEYEKARAQEYEKARVQQ